MHNCLEIIYAYKNVLLIVNKYLKNSEDIIEATICKYFSIPVSFLDELEPSIRLNLVDIVGQMKSELIDIKTFCNSNPTIEYDIVAKIIGVGNQKDGVQRIIVADQSEQLFVTVQSVYTLKLNDIIHLSGIRPNKRKRLQGRKTARLSLDGGCYKLPFTIPTLDDIKIQILTPRTINVDELDEDVSTPRLYTLKGIVTLFGELEKGNQKLIIISIQVLT